MSGANAGPADRHLRRGQRTIKRSGVIVPRLNHWLRGVTASLFLALAGVYPSQYHSKAWAKAGPLGHFLSVNYSVSDRVVHPMLRKLQPFIRAPDATAPATPWGRGAVGRSGGHELLGYHRQRARQSYIGIWWAEYEIAIKPEPYISGMWSESGPQCSSVPGSGHGNDALQDGVQWGLCPPQSWQECG